MGEPVPFPCILGEIFLFFCCVCPDDRTDRRPTDGGEGMEESWRRPSALVKLFTHHYR